MHAPILAAASQSPGPELAAATGATWTGSCFGGGGGAGGGASTGLVLVTCVIALVGAVVWRTWISGSGMNGGGGGASFGGGGGGG